MIDCSATFQLPHLLRNVFLPYFPASAYCFLVGGPFVIVATRLRSDMRQSVDIFIKLLVNYFFLRIICSITYWTNPLRNGRNIYGSGTAVGLVKTNKEQNMKEKTLELKVVCSCNEKNERLPPLCTVSEDGKVVISYADLVSGLQALLNRIE